MPLDVIAPSLIARSQLTMERVVISAIVAVLLASLFSMLPHRTL
jgi:hypothetical protein